MYPAQERNCIQHHCYRGSVSCCGGGDSWRRGSVSCRRGLGLFFCLSPCAGCKTRQGDDVAVWKHPSLLEGFSDGYSVHGSQETFCIRRKGFIPVFLCCSPSKWTIIFGNLSHFAIFPSLLEHDTPCKCPFGHLLSHIKQQTIGSNFY